MKRILKWLETRLSRHSPVDDADEPQSTVKDKVRTGQVAQKETSVEPGLDMGKSGRAENHEPGKGIPMPDIYASDDTITEEVLKTFDESSLDDSESPGFNPYDTGTLQKK